MFLIFISVSDVISYVVFFEQKTAYEMRISDWSSDVCSSDLFAAFFIVVGAKTSVAESVCDALFILQNMLCLFCVRENTRRRKHTQVQFCGCFGWFKARNRLQKCLEKFSLAFFAEADRQSKLGFKHTPYMRTEIRRASCRERECQYV